MSARWLAPFAIAGAIFSVCPASAQPAQQLPRSPGEWRLSLFAGIDPEPRFGAGYQRTLPLVPLAGPLEVGGFVSVPPLLLRRGFNARLAGTARARVVGGGFWAVPAEAALQLDFVHTNALRAFGTSVDLGVLPGHYAQAWFFRLEVQGTLNLLSQFSFTERGESVPEDPGISAPPRGGLYGFSGGYWLLGAAVGGEPLERFELSARAGFKFSLGFRNPWAAIDAQAVYVVLASTYRFD